MTVDEAWISIRRSLHDVRVAKVCLKGASGQMQDDAMVQYTKAVDDVIADLLMLDQAGYLPIRYSNSTALGAR